MRTCYVLFDDGGQDEEVCAEWAIVFTTPNSLEQKLRLLLVFRVVTKYEYFVANCFLTGVRFQW